MEKSSKIYIAGHRQYLFNETLQWLRNCQCWSWRRDIHTGTRNLHKKCCKFWGNIKFDMSKPDGAPRKSLDISKLKRLGWQAKISLKDGLKKTYNWFVEHIGESVRI